MDAQDSKINDFLAELRELRNGNVHGTDDAGHGYVALKKTKRNENGGVKNARNALSRSVKRRSRQNVASSRRRSTVPSLV